MLRCPHLQPPPALAWQPQLRLREGRARTCERMQVAQVLAGLGGMLTPHMQHSTWPFNCSSGALLSAIARLRERAAVGKILPGF